MPDFMSMSSGAVSAAFAGLSVLFSVVFYLQSTLSQRRSITLELWKLWASKEYRGYRVRSSREISHAKAQNPSAPPRLADLMQDADFEEAFGSVEHFFEEVASLKEADLLDNALLVKLFRQSARAWRVTFTDLDKDGADAFDAPTLDRAFSIILEESLDWSKKQLSH